MRTVSYKLADLGKVVIHLGKMAENDATQVRIDAAEVFSEYPNAVPALDVINPSGEAYTVEVTLDGTVIVWDVKDSSLTAEGNGEIQLTFTQDGTKVKSSICRTQVCRSITGGGTAPDPVQDWLDHANEVLEETGAALETLENMTASASALPAGSNPTATYQNGNIAFGIPKGDKGDTGAAGQNGVTPNVTAGTTTTGAAGTSASVTRRAGSPDSAPIFDFTIPKGDKGDHGDLQLDSTLTSASAAAPADQVGNLKSALQVLEPSASASDIGKALIVKTVSDGKATSYEYGEAGGGGTSDYDDLTDKPQIGGVTLAGNKTAAQLGLLSGEDVSTAVDDWLEENFTNPSNPPLDRSLLSSSSAAPADIVGGIANLEAVTSSRLLSPFAQGGIKSTTGEIDTTDETKCYFGPIAVSAGDKVAYSRYNSKINTSSVLFLYDSNGTYQSYETFNSGNTYTFASNGKFALRCGLNSATMEQAIECANNSFTITMTKEVKLVETVNKLDEIRDATAQDANKALSPKTIVGGVVTEWQFKTIPEGGGTFIIDDDFSTSSTNPVQNKVITNAVQVLNKKTSDTISLSANIFNPNDENYLPGYYIGGQYPTQSSSYNATGFIPVESGQSIIFSNDGQPVQGRFVCVYSNADMSYYESYSSNLDYYTNSGANDVYVRVSFKSEYTKFQIEYGTDITSYVPYGKYFIDGLADAVNNVRKQYHIYATNDITDFYNSMEAALEAGNMDVYIHRGSYVFTDAFIEMLLTKPQKAVPIGNGNRYFFETGAKIVAKYTTGNPSSYWYVFAPVDGVYGSFELHNLNLDAAKVCYGIHDEYAGKRDGYRNVYDHCRIVVDNTGYSTGDNGVNKCIGGGLGGNAEIIIDGCYFDCVTSPTQDVSYHGATGTNKGDNANIIVKDSWFRNTFSINGSVSATSEEEKNVIFCGNCMGSPLRFASQDIEPYWNVTQWNNTVRSN